MLPIPLETRIKEYICQNAGNPVETLRVRSVMGGSINQAAAVSGGGVTLFIKWNNSAKYPGLFDAEARGLRLLKDHGALVPHVLETGIADHFSYIFMEYVERRDPGPGSSEKFGVMLADLHRVTAPFYGLDHANYMGSLPQLNNPHRTWNDFFINERILPQLIRAVNNGMLFSSDARKFDRLFLKLPDLIPAEPPSLVHGDLWSGNYIAGSDSNTWLVDPAVAYGHREVDIAMTFLFGGFSANFYDAYQESFPLEQEWESRLGLFQLYPLLVHVNLFGSGYSEAVRSIVSPF